MSGKRRPIALALAFTLSSGTFAALALPAEAAAKKSTYSTTLAKAIEALPIAAENGAGYKRNDYPHWIDANKDCQDTRVEVAIIESTSKPTATCKTVKGKWTSYYDGVTTTNLSSFDLDHMVPLKEAHASGARNWNKATRQAYANDMDYAGSLVLVTAKSNRSKSDRDPAKWMPAKNHCRYITEWVSVKHRWGLTVDTAEKKKLRSFKSKCSSYKIKVVKATVVKGSPTPTAPTTPSTGSESGLRVMGIMYDPAGTDTLNGEYVTLKNTTGAAITLTGWKLMDATGTTYTFPAVKLATNSTLVLYTGSGVNNSGSLYWGRGTAVWNNGGDSFKLLTPSGKIAQSGSYTGKGDGGSASF